MKLYNVKEAARIIGVSTNTLYKYLDDGKIHAARGTALQGRFRIPESALEEFLGVKLSEPESVGATFTVARNNEIEPQVAESHGQVQDLPLQPSKSHLPQKIARLFLLIALMSVLIDLFTSRTVSLPAMLSRLFFLITMLLLAYQEGGYRRKSV